jgi:hypothetical protein
VYRWDVTHVPAGGSARHQLTVVASIPLRGESNSSGSGGGGDCADGECAGGAGAGAGGSVVVSKDGPLLPSERAVVTRAVRAANLTFDDRVRGRGQRRGAAAGA